jgi:hypothetical protein
VTVFLWQDNDVIGPADDYNSRYLTDIFRKGTKPKYGSVVLATGAPLDHPGPSSIVAIGRARAPSGVSQGKVRVRLEPWALVTPLDLEVLNQRLIERGFPDRAFDEPSPLRAVLLTPRLGDAVLQILKEHDPSVVTWLQRPWRPATSVDADEAQVIAETQDAIRVAAELADISLPTGALEPEQDTSSASTLMRKIVDSAHLFDLEEDLIPEDLRRFDGELTPTMLSGSVAMFRSKDYQLTVFNVNKKLVEVHLGIDLIYWDVTNDVFTLLQYKRLEREPSARGTVAQWIYTRKSEIEKQLRLMPSTAVPPGTSTEWRMTQTPFWFKFVRGDAGRVQDGKLLKGMYIPADYLRLAVADGSLMTGPKAGFRVSYSNAKYITRGIFVDLVKRGLIGTTSVQSKDLHAVVEDLTKDGRSVVVAMKSKWQRSAVGSVIHP